LTYLSLTIPCSTLLRFAAQRLHGGSSQAQDGQAKATWNLAPPSRTWLALDAGYLLWPVNRQRIGNVRNKAAEVAEPVP
jgi:hypothetical protein